MLYVKANFPPFTSLCQNDSPLKSSIYHPEKQANKHFQHMDSLTTLTAMKNNMKLTKKSSFHS